MEVKRTSKRGMKIGSMEILFHEAEYDRVDFMGCMIFGDVSVCVFHDGEDSGADWWLEVSAWIKGQVVFIRKYHNLPMHKCIEAQDIATGIQTYKPKHR